MRAIILAVAATLAAPGLAQDVTGPDGLAGALARAEAARARLDLPGALATLDAAIAAAPDAAAPLVARAAIHRSMGRPSLALADLDAALALAPGDVAALTLRAETLRRAGDLDGAAADYARAGALAPGDPGLAAAEAAALAEAGRRPEALAALARACDLAPEDGRSCAARDGLLADLANEMRPGFIFAPEALVGEAFTASEGEEDAPNHLILVRDGARLDADGAVSPERLAAAVSAGVLRVTHVFTYSGRTSTIWANLALICAGPALDETEAALVSPEGQDALDGIERGDGTGAFAALVAGAYARGGQEAGRVEGCALDRDHALAYLANWTVAQEQIGWRGATYLDRAPSHVLNAEPVAAGWLDVWLAAQTAPQGTAAPAPGPGGEISGEAAAPGPEIGPEPDAENTADAGAEPAGDETTPQDAAASGTPDADDGAELVPVTVAEAALARITLPPPVELPVAVPGAPPAGEREVLPGGDDAPPDGGPEGMAGGDPEPPVPAAGDGAEPSSADASGVAPADEAADLPPADPDPAPMAGTGPQDPNAEADPDADTGEADPDAVAGDGPPADGEPDPLDPDADMLAAEADPDADIVAGEANADAGDGPPAGAEPGPLDADADTDAGEVDPDAGDGPPADGEPGPLDPDADTDAREADALDADAGDGTAANSEPAPTGPDMDMVAGEVDADAGDGPPVDDEPGPPDADADPGVDASVADADGGAADTDPSGGTPEGAEPGPTGPDKDTDAGEVDADAGDGPPADGEPGPPDPDADPDGGEADTVTDPGDGPPADGEPEPLDPDAGVTDALDPDADTDAGDADALDADADMVAGDADALDADAGGGPPAGAEPGPLDPDGTAPAPAAGDIRLARDLKGIWAPSLTQCLAYLDAIETPETLDQAMPDPAADPPLGAMLVTSRGAQVFDASGRVCVVESVSEAGEESDALLSCTGAGGGVGTMRLHAYPSGGPAPWLDVTRGNAEAVTMRQCLTLGQLGVRFADLWQIDKAACTARAPLRAMALEFRPADGALWVTLYPAAEGAALPGATGLAASVDGVTLTPGSGRTESGAYSAPLGTFEDVSRQLSFGMFLDLTASGESGFEPLRLPLLGSSRAMAALADCAG